MQYEISREYPQSYLKERISCLVANVYLKSTHINRSSEFQIALSDLRSGNLNDKKVLYILFHSDPFHYESASQILFEIPHEPPIRFINGTYTLLNDYYMFYCFDVNCTPYTL